MSNSAPPVEYGQTLTQLEKSLDKQQAKSKKLNTNSSSRGNSVGPSPLIPAHIGNELDQFTLSPSNSSNSPITVIVMSPERTQFNPPQVHLSTNTSSETKSKSTLSSIKDSYDNKKDNRIKEIKSDVATSGNNNDTENSLNNKKSKGSRPESAEHSHESKPRLSKEERRAQQEAQRLKKGQAANGNDQKQSSKAEKPPQPPHQEKITVKSVQSPKVQGKSVRDVTFKDKTKEGVSPHVKITNPSAPPPLISRQSVVLQHDDEKKMAKQAKQAAIQRQGIHESKQISSFTHLSQYLKLSLLNTKIGFSMEDVHPSFLQLGLKFEKEVLVGATARCSAFLCALKDVILDYECPPTKAFAPDIMAHINKCAIRFLVNCRPLTTGMKNTISWLKKEIGQLDLLLTNDKAKEKLIKQIDQFIVDRITDCDIGIVQSAVDKIVENDTILTYGHSHLVENILLKCKSTNKKIRIIICDSRPKLEGKELARRLVCQGLEVTYVLINALPYIMPSVTKVLMGASSILSNGNVLSRVGTAVVAMIASNYNVPVLICCQSFKFSERVQLDSICFNELGDPDELVKGHDELKNWMFSSEETTADGPVYSNLKILNLLYDLTPARYISMVVTEIGLIPPTSVPVVIREYRKELY